MKLCYIWFLFCFFLVCACSTNDDYSDIKGDKFGAIPLCFDPADTGNSLFETIKLGIIPDGNKLSTKQISLNTYLDIYDNKGIFVHNPDTSYFFNVLGARWITLTDSVFTIKSYIGEANFKIVNNLVVPVDFHFKIETRIVPINEDIKWTIWDRTHSHTLYFTCPPPPPILVVGWLTGNIKDPKCYTYY